MNGVWKERQTLEGSMEILIYLRADRYDSIVDIDRPWVPSNATNKVTFSEVMGEGVILREFTKLR